MRTHILIIGLIGCLAGAAPAAGMKLADSGGSIPAFTGSQLFDNSLSGFTITANVDFAVFAPGTFETAFPGLDPSAGAHYVYAYQIENLATDVTKFSVGLDGDESLGSVGFIGDTGLADPNSSRFVGAGPTSVSWDFEAGELINGTSSAVLLFTSANAPEQDSATVLAAFADTQSLPSPVPEPGSVALTGLGGAMLMRRARMRTHLRLKYEAKEVK